MAGVRGGYLRMLSTMIGQQLGFLNVGDVLFFYSKSLPFVETTHPGHANGVCGDASPGWLGRHSALLHLN